ncbi:MAG: PRC-barrel domain-containing protein [Clostridia bacterium]|nr:PRC-barrel domain-containing protein [Clostridia bacterium]
MRRLSELLSKPVISLYEGKTEGTIKNAVFNKNLKKLKWLVLFDDQDMLEQKFLPAKEVFSIGENAVIIKNSQAIIPNLPDIDEQRQNNPINTPIYTVSGNLIDRVGDVILDEKNALQIIELKSGKELTPEQIVVSGQDTLILQDENKPININNFKEKSFPKPKADLEKTKVKIMQTEVAPKNSKPKPEPVSEPKPEPKPELKPEHKPEPKPELKPEPEPEPKKNKILAVEEQKVSNSNELVKEEPINKKISPEIIEQPNSQDESVFEITKGIDEANEELEKAKQQLIQKKEELTGQIEQLKEDVKEVVKPKRLKKEKPKKLPKTKALSTVEEKPRLPRAKNFVFNEKTALPTKVLCNTSFLLNRICTKNIYTLNNEIIIKRGENISQSKIDKTLLHGKLQELIKFSK